MLKIAHHLIPNLCTIVIYSKLSNMIVVHSLGCWLCVGFGCMYLSSCCHRYKSLDLEGLMVPHEHEGGVVFKLIKI